eukprot:4023034-Amphidinium_carterae.1
MATQEHKDSPSFKVALPLTVDGSQLKEGPFIWRSLLFLPTNHGYQCDRTEAMLFEDSGIKRILSKDTHENCCQGGRIHEAALWPQLRCRLGNRLHSLCGLPIIRRLL